MRTPLCCSVIFFSSILSTIKADTLDVIQRDPVDVHLANLSICIDQKSGSCEKVRITYYDSKDQIIITSLDDTYIKNSRNGSEKIVYRENLNNSYLVSLFEAKQLELVNKSLLITLEQLDKFLQNNQWGKCLYLDSFFPRFLRGYFYLLNIIQSTYDALPESANVADSLFDISLNSQKSDMRINKWKSSPEYVVKLRIATNELLHQIKTGQQKFSKNKEKDFTSIICKDYANSLGLFVSIYFNRVPNK